MDATIDFQTLRRHFSEGGCLPARQLSAELEQSWLRSREAGLMPHSRRLEYVPPSPQRIQETRENNQWLIRHLDPEMQLLWQSMADPRRMLLCIDSSGLIVHSLSAGRGAEAELHGLPVGRQILEHELGTTAPSCVLLNSSPCMISSSQHYLSELDRFFCSAVPIRHPGGELLAVLDFSAIDSLPPFWLQERLRLAAMAIENRLYQELTDCYLLHVHHDARLLDTPLEGILAVSADGSIIEANTVARSLLGLPARGGLSAQLPLSALLVEETLRPLERLQQFPGDTVSMPLSSGHSLYARGHPTGGQQTPVLCRAVTHTALAISPFAGEPTLRRAFDMACRAFQGGVAILLQGETGVGKEVFSRALHDSIAPQQPFVAINCSAIPADLIESELFGYSEGAFTGGRKGGAVGKIEQANGGTLFLDEIGDMPLSLQTRLLRVLQERSLTRLGDNRSIALEFRLVSASLRELDALIQTGTFREDLYYRINGLRVVLPALRERENIDQLIVTLLHQQSPEMPKQLSEQALQALIGYHWPGNVRQLQQALKVAVILSADRAVIELDDFPPDLRRQLHPASCPGRSGLLFNMERELIQQELQKHQGNMSATAKSLGISRSTLYKKLEAE
jgi:transcriptional regulator of acetoin/glycerol metabolism